ncbi:HAD family hydrolase [Aurantimonas sp. Leaf443]|uniref:HAD family hydrolase n=1 Tax=Aurantimonas sp. Leaf443 TaxID=1736378 RepID=UPI0009E8152E|nr:HAD family hydrolase [Aurantimonas sp. Leaf443]
MLPPVAVFDLDGTLVDTAPDLCASLNHCLASAGMGALPLERVRPHAGHGSRVMLAKAYEWDGRTIEGAALDREVARFLEHYAENIAVDSRPFPGVLQAMDRLEAAGWRLAICTNKYERFAVKLIAALGLSHRFEAVCGADTFATRKPDAGHLLGTIDRARGARERSVMIGDTSTDIDAAANAGVPSILLDFGYDPEPRARERATTIIAHYDQLDAALLDRLLAEAGTGRRTSAG